ncbi:MAG: Ig-like domain-containing protein [Chloroflexi bacterium]|nr:Ig-like domain-containing protein [Chloroflexota bacterium]
MSNKTRKRLWPVSLVMALAIVGVAAALLIVASSPSSTQAHDPDPPLYGDDHCAAIPDDLKPLHDAVAGDHTCDNPPMAPVNVSPIAAADIDNQYLAPGETAMVMSTITDADAGDTLTWAWSSTDRAVATVMMDATDGSKATVTAVADGTATIMVTATDAAGLSAPQTFMVTVETPAMPSVASSSTSGSATVELKLTIPSLPIDVPVGGAIVLILEDDYQQPASISASSAYFVAEGGDEMQRKQTGNGSRVYATINPEIDTDDYFTADKKDIDIRVQVPDMCPNATNDCEGDNGLVMGQKVTLVLQKSADIKNPPEEGVHSTGYAVLTPTQGVPTNSQKGDVSIGQWESLNTLNTWAKIGISDVDNSRGYEMTVTGSGFNDGTTAAVYVKANPTRFEAADYWETLDCDGMKALLNSDDDKYCFHFVLDQSAMTYTLGTGSDAFTNLTAAEKTAVANEAIAASKCGGIIRHGTEVGGALVGTDDKAVVTFEVTAPTFQPGNVNYMCMVDGEGRASHRDVEDFNLQPSIKVVPSSVASGDTVNVFAQDFPAGTGGFVELKIAGQTIPGVVGSSIRQDGSGEATFDVPGGLEGVLRIDAKWGDVNEDSKITITGGDLSVSKTDALPNETLTITGNGFGSQTCIPSSNITLDNVEMMVHPDSNSEDCAGEAVKVSNSGQFVATVILWPKTSGATNPTLIPGIHELEFEDDNGFSASVSLTIDEPTITVTPDIAGPRDYITITGENWPVDNLDNTLNSPVTVCVEDYGSGETCNGRSYPVYADAVGRFTVEHRVHRRVAIPDTVQLKATYRDVAKIGSFAVPASTVEVTPSEAQPGDTLSLSATNMPVYTKVEYVEVGGTRQIHEGVNTDRDGNVQVDEVLVPGLDPGVYSVVIAVGERDNRTIAIGEVNVLAESSAAGAPAALPGAVENLGDSLVAIFHFDDVGKNWSFYDPRPEFADLNTLTEMVNGEAYWILVSETVEDVVLNNKVRSLTCRGDDCWNLEVW